MLEYLKAKANTAHTENGAKAYATSGSDCLDLFATVGALRSARESEITKRFMRAYTEDKDMATKLLFFARDVREGLGERRVFRVMLKWLANNAPETVRKNIKYVAEYGRYDDLLSLFGTPCETDALEAIKEQLAIDTESLKAGREVSLLGKWLPSVNTSSNVAVIRAKKIAKYLGMNDAEYRRTLVALRAKIDIIENHLRTREYDFDYSKQPSRALFIYRKAFLNNDYDRYMEFKEDVAEGRVKLNTSNLVPYELVESVMNRDYFSEDAVKEMSEDEAAILNMTWDNLPDYCGAANALPVIDLSGSMYSFAKPSPASVALSLGIYAAERTKGKFFNHFIMFSKTPQLIEIKGDDFVSKLRYVSSFSEIANTNLEAVFDLILNTAVENGLEQSLLPEKLFIVSDMEFDASLGFHADRNTIFESAKKKYADAGYELPEVIFWNVASRSTHQPVTKDENGVVLVSGCTPKLFSMILEGKTSPYLFMLEVLNSERYAQITA